MNKTQLTPILLTLGLLWTALAYGDSPYNLEVPIADQARLIPAITRAVNDLPETYYLNEEVCILPTCSEGKGITFLSFKEAESENTFEILPNKQLEFSFFEQKESIRVSLQVYQVYNQPGNITGGLIAKKRARLLKAHILKALQEPPSPENTR